MPLRQLSILTIKQAVNKTGAPAFKTLKQQPSKNHLWETRSSKINYRNNAERVLATGTFARTFRAVRIPMGGRDQPTESMLPTQRQNPKPQGGWRKVLTRQWLKAVTMFRAALLIFQRAAMFVGSRAPGDESNSTLVINENYRT